MSNFYFRCDNCGRETNGITFINGMKFCAKCYQETFGKDNQRNEIQQLKQQLAEKDKEIERLKVFEKAYYFNLSPVSKEYIKLMLQNAYQIPNNTQLAIQELEKVRNYVDGRTYCADYINKRIQELKGE